ncbi:MAG: hypothetical protein JO021_13785 [Alphaproteobacteria bacterium]|nr:hypothetical protein [Alphaproteobacteria bacterium]
MTAPIFGVTMLVACAQPPSTTDLGAVRDGARAVFDGKVLAELQMGGDGRGECLVELHRAPDMTPCLRIGRVGVGLHRRDVEDLLGPPTQTRPKGTIEQRVYVVEESKPWMTYFVVEYRDDHTVAVQFTGAPSAPSEHKLAGIALGDPKDVVVARLGPAIGKCPISEIQALVWTWRLPLSLEIREGRVFSMRVGNDPAPKPTSGADTVAHFQSSPRAGSPVDPPRRSLDDLADSIAKTGRSAERGAIADIAWPADRAEAEMLGWHGVVHVIAASRSPAELPMRKVYVHADATPLIELTRIGNPAVTKLDPEGVVARVFGPVQGDAFFLVPIGAAGCNGDVSIDFAEARNGFSVIALPGTLPPALIEDEYREPGKPDPDALRRFIRREFPAEPIDKRQLAAGR